MISRLTAIATVFAVAATTALAITAQAHAPAHAVAVEVQAAQVAKTVRIIELPRVTIVARRVGQ